LWLRHHTFNLTPPTLATLKKGGIFLKGIQEMNNIAIYIICWIFGIQIIERIQKIIKSFRIMKKEPILFMAEIYWNSSPLVIRALVIDIAITDWLI
jgi:hypothetical protein